MADLIGSRRSRREFLRGLSAAALASSSLGCARSGTDGGRPNVLFLISDQHRADVAGFAGDANAHTPVLDELARQSARVSDVYCQVPLCAPARQSLLTGEYAHTHLTFRNNAVNAEIGLPTLAHALSAAGYETALFGKTHCDVSGFEHVRELKDMLADFAREHPGAHRPGSAHYTWDRADQDYDYVAMMNPGFLPAGEGSFFMEDAVAREAAEFVSRERERPFFAWASFVNPHPPLFPPDEFRALFEGRDLPLLGSLGSEQPGLLPFHRKVRERQAILGVTDGQLLNITRAYYASLAWTDHCIGRTLEALEASGASENTIVVYTSDHGEMLGQHGLLKKMNFFEGSTRVPLMLRWPGRFAPAVHARVAQHVDLTRTLHDLLDVPPLSERPAGRSMSAFLSASTGGGSWDDIAVAELSGGDALHWMIRSGRHKYVWHDRGGAALYDLEDDPLEERELASLPERAELVQDLRALFERTTAETEWNVRPARW